MANSITRLATAGPRGIEVAKLPADVAGFVAPLLDAGRVTVAATCLLGEKELRIGDRLYFSLAVSLTEAAFVAPEGEAGAGLGDAERALADHMQTLLAYDPTLDLGVTLTHARGALPPPPSAVYRQPRSALAHGR